jgi:hypothetical protein
MVREGAGNDFETDPESQHAVEIFNWQLISSRFQCVSKSLVLSGAIGDRVATQVITMPERENMEK